MGWAEIIKLVVAALPGLLTAGGSIWWGKQALEAKDAALAQKDETLRSKDTEIRAMAAQLAAKDEAAKVLQSQIQFYQAVTPNLEGFVKLGTAQATRQKVLVEAQLAEAQAELAEKEQRLRAQQLNQFLAAQTQRERDELAQRVSDLERERDLAQQGAELAREVSRLLEEVTKTSDQKRIRKWLLANAERLFPSTLTDEQIAQMLDDYRERRANEAFFRAYLQRMEQELAPGRDGEQ